MTAPQELHKRIDRLAPQGLEAVLATIEEQERIQAHLEALTAFQKDWTHDEQAAWDEGTKRRPWRATPLEDDG